VKVSTARPKRFSYTGSAQDRTNWQSRKSHIWNDFLCLVTQYCLHYATLPEVQRLRHVWKDIHLVFHVLRIIAHNHISVTINCWKRSQAEFVALKGTRMQVMCSVTQLMIFPITSLLPSLPNFTHTRKKLRLSVRPFSWKSEMINRIMRRFVRPDFTQIGHRTVKYGQKSFAATQ